MTVPVLWHFPISHYNEKVRWALDFKGIPHQRRALAMDYIPRALWKTGQMSLPVLLLDGKAVADSTHIIAALEQHRPDPPLYPRDEAERRRALALEDFFDEELGHALRAAVLGPIFERDPAAALGILTTGMNATAARAARMVLPLFRAFYTSRHRINAATVAEGRAKVVAAFDRLETELGPRGYLVGERFTVADLTAAALFSPLVSPPEFPYPPAVAMPESMASFRESLAGRAGFQWVLDTYRRHRGTSAEIAA